MRYAVALLVTSYQLTYVFIGPTNLRVPISCNAAPRRSKRLCFASPNSQTISVASFRITQLPIDASSFVSCHPTPKRCQQLHFVSPSPQTKQAASSCITQAPDDASSFVSWHPTPKRSQQLRFVSPSPQTKQAASFYVIWPQTTPGASFHISGLGYRVFR